MFGDAGGGVGRDPKVMVQLREAIECLCLPRKWPPHRWYKRFGVLDEWTSIADSLGCADSDLLPLRKQAAAAGLPIELVRCCMQEQMCSTVLLLCHLCQWSSRLQQDRRTQAKRALYDILTKVLPRDLGASPLELPLAPADEGFGCRAPGSPPLQPECCHARALVGAGSASVTTARRSQCPAMRRWHFALVALVGAALDEALRQPQLWHATAEGVIVPRGAQKRRRLDEDLLRGAAMAMVSSKRLRSAAAASRSGALDVHENSAVDHEDVAVRDYIRGTLAVMEDSSQVTVAFDESNVSKECTLASVIYDHRSGKIAIGVPQVSVVQLAIRSRDRECKSRIPICGVWKRSRL